MEAAGGAACTTFRKNDVVFRERPCFTYETLSSRKHSLSCSHCQNQFCWETQLSVATIGRAATLDLPCSPKSLRVRCQRMGCLEVYCSEACKRQHSSAGHELLCLGESCDGDMPLGGPSNVNLLRNFKKHALATSEMYLVAAKLIASWIGLSYDIAMNTTDSKENGPNLFFQFQDSMNVKAKTFFGRFPENPNKHNNSCLAENKCDKTKKRNRRQMEGARNCSSGGSDELEESWLLFNAAMLHGRCRDWTGPLLAQCQSQYSNCPKNGAAGTIFFSFSLWSSVLSCLQCHVLAVSAISPMVSPIRDAILTVDKSERWKKAQPFLEAFKNNSKFSFVADEYVSVPVASDVGVFFERDFERKITRLAQLGLPQSEGDTIFDIYHSHYLVLLVDLNPRAHASFSIARRRIAHSCLSNTHFEVYQDRTPTAEIDLHTVLCCRLIATRDIRLGIRDNAEDLSLSDNTITVSRFQVLGNGCSEEYHEASALSDTRGRYDSRQKELASLFCQEGYVCQCPLCVYERLDLAGEIAELNLSFLDELLDHAANSMEQMRHQAISAVPTLPPPHPLIEHMDLSLLYAIGQHYMQDHCFSCAAKVYGQIIRINHQLFHHNVYSKDPVFDATGYFHLGSALLDAGLSKEAFNTWATGHLLDLKNDLLRNQWIKDNSFYYVRCSTNADGTIMSVLCPDMVRNYKIYSQESLQASSSCRLTPSIDRVTEVKMNTASQLKAFGLGIFRSREDHRVLTILEADSIISFAETYANTPVETTENGRTKIKPRGWTTSRHYDAPTTDIPVQTIPEVLAIFNNCLMTRLGPILYSLLKAQHRVDCPINFYINDAFIVKYEVPNNSSQAIPSQRFLPIHADQSHYSFTIALNSQTDYEGGGTYFVDLEEAISVDKGHCLFFPGSLRHGGDPITKGSRYILAVFVFLSPNIIKSTSGTLNPILGSVELSDTLENSSSAKQIQEICETSGVLRSSSSCSGKSENNFLSFAFNFVDDEHKSC